MYGSNVVCSMPSSVGTHLAHIRKQTNLTPPAPIQSEGQAVNTRPLRSIALLRLWAALFVLFICGCTTTPPRLSGPAEPPRKELLLQTGDVVAVKFVYWPELDEEQAVRPDGKLSLPLVGEVEAEGLTPAQLNANLLNLYQDKLVNPEINVVVRSLDSQRIFVGGEVKTPGGLPLQGRMTALQAVVQAGGFLKDSARMSSVVVVRQQGGKQVATTLDLSRPMEQLETEPFYLQPYDVVYVPRTAIDRVDQWVEQYVNKVIPRNLHYTFSDIVNEKDDGQARSYTLQPRINLTPGAQ
jgi:protein involved in polysaccharide export with SLBB domain